jgi:AcrB/AcrD/AcrF family
MVVFIVLTIQFQSLRLPFAMLFTIPVCLVGITLVLAGVRQIFSITALMGMLMVVGIAVSNGMDEANVRLGAGATKEDAVVDAARTRFTPIVMTSLATVLGLVPSAIRLERGRPTSRLRWPSSAALVDGALPLPRALHLHAAGPQERAARGGGAPSHEHHAALAYGDAHRSGADHVLEFRCELTVQRDARLGGGLGAAKLVEALPRLLAVPTRTGIVFLRLTDRRRLTLRVFQGRGAPAPARVQRCGLLRRRQEGRCADGRPARRRSADGADRAARRGRWPRARHVARGLPGWSSALTRCRSGWGERVTKRPRLVPSGVAPLLR